MIGTDPGTYELGADNARLRALTRRAGAVAKAGHDLDMEVTSWKATLELREPVLEGALQLEADSSSLEVRSGTGGVKALGDDDVTEIEKTIDDEVLKHTPISFRSTSIAPAATGLSVEGELELGGASQDAKVSG